MRLFYTGSETFLAEQKNINASVGGFISNVVIPNGRLENFFGEITNYTIDDNLASIIGIVLKNELSNDVEDILLHFDFDEDTFLKLEIAAVDVTEGEEGVLSIEQLRSNRDLPYFVEEFNEANGEENAINIGDLKQGEFVGIWIKRILLEDIKEKNFDCEVLNTNFGQEPNELNALVTIDPIPVKKQDNVILNLNWTDIVEP